MAHGDFVWCDLSTRNIETTQRFYRRLFEWNFAKEPAPDQSDYWIVYRNASIAGMFQMPKKFHRLGLPCFWMPYIEVDSITSAIDIATRHGGKVEVGPTEGIGGARIALVRDPLGAGFTLIEGHALEPRRKNPKHGEVAWNELYVSDAEAVIPFYKALFNWDISYADPAANRFDISVNGGACSALYELPDSQRGKFQFWGIYFAVDDLNAARTSIREDGEILYDRDGAVLAHDPDGAAFFVIEREVLQLMKKGRHAGLGKTSTGLFARLADAFRTSD